MTVGYLRHKCCLPTSIFLPFPHPGMFKLVLIGEYNYFKITNETYRQH